MFEGIISQQVIYAAGWTIIHSLWQGGVAAMFLSLFYWLVRDKKAEIRYAAALVVFFLLIASAAVTFLLYYNGPATAGTAGTGGITRIITDGKSVTGSVYSEPESFGFIQENFLYIKSLMSENLPNLVTLWLAGMIIFALRLLYNYGSLVTLRRSALPVSNPAIINMLEKLTGKVRVNRNVELFESGKVASPCSAGIVKPVIYFPIGLLTGMSNEQIEAVMLHELAHIKRYDYLVNLLQSVIEVLFFFNPGMWFVSNRIRDERENICDDITVGITGKEFVYAKTLLNLAENNTGLVMPVSGRNNKLFRRIHRMTTNIKRDDDGRAALLTLGIVLVLSVVMYACSGSEAAENADSPSGIMAVEALADSLEPAEPTEPAEPMEPAEPAVPAEPTEPAIPAKVAEGEKMISVVTNEDGEEITWNIYYDINGDVKEAWKNGKKLEGEEKIIAERIVREELNGHTEDVRVFRFDSTPFDKDFEKNIELYGRKFSKMFSDTSEFGKKMQNIFSEIKIEKMPKLDSVFARMPDLDSLFNSEELKANMAILGENMKNLKINIGDRDFVYFDSLGNKLKNMKIDVDLSGLDSSMKRLNIKLRGFDKKSEELEIKLDSLDLHLEGLDEDLDKLDRFLEKAKAELVSDGYIESTDNHFGMVLNEEIMEINGERLPEKLHQKYLRMYEKIYGEKPGGKIEIK